MNEKQSIRLCRLTKNQRVLLRKYKKKHVNPFKKKEINIDFIQEKICMYYNLDLEKLYLKTRKREIVFPRQVAMYFSRNLLKKEYQFIGNKIGGKDHATVMHACRTVKNLMETNVKIKNQIKEINVKYFQ